MAWQKRVYEIVEVAAPDDQASRAFDLFMLALIALNIVALVLETVDPLYQAATPFFRALERVSIVLFSLEYLLRLWSCTTSGAYSHPVWGRLRFAFTPLALIDLLAVLPFYLPILSLDLRFLRALRMFRLFRAAKLTRYSQALQTFGRVVLAKKEELLTTLFLLLLLLLLASSLMYLAEHDAQPEEFASIPAAMWWAVATLTTVGYGDVVPMTPLGKVLASTIAILGIGVFALPTGILSVAFVEELRNRTRDLDICPHCGQKLPRSA